MSSVEKRKEYDEEPVQYCANCYSLKIKYEDAIDADCCMECGSLNIAEASIEEWEKLYEKRYGKKFVVKNNDPKKSFVFNLSIGDLKKRLYESKDLNTIVSSLYPNFPEGLTKADKIVVLFDRLVRDNKLNDLRFLLIEYS